MRPRHPGAAASWYLTAAILERNMSYAALFLLIAALAVVGYWLGKYRALALVGGGKGIRRLHSLPSYYGLLTALWASLPCVLVLILWGALQEPIIGTLVRQHLADRQLAGHAAQVGLFMNDVHNVLAGSVPADQASPAVQAAAVDYAHLRNIAARARTGLVLAMSVTALWF